MKTGWGKRRTSALSLAAATAALISLTPVGAGLAYAAEGDLPAELVIPAEESVVRDAGIVRPGATGFLQGDRAVRFRWYSYADGSSRPFDSKSATAIFTNGTDTIARWYSASNKVVLQDVAGGAEETIQLGAGQSVVGMAGRTVITEGTTADARLHAVSLVNGTVLDRPVTGFPADADDFRFEGATSYGVQVSYFGGGAQDDRAWVDLSGDTPKLVPLDGTGASVVHGDSLLHVKDGKLQVWDLKGDWSAPVRETGWAGSDVPVAVQGDQVLSLVGGDGGKLLSRPFAGGEQTTVLDGLVASPRLEGGDLLAVVKGEGAERPVHRVQAGADGGFVAEKKAVIPGDRTTTGRISVAQGVLHLVDQVPSGEFRLRSVETKAAGPLVAGDRTDHGFDDRLDPSYETVATGDGRIVRRYSNGLYVTALAEQLYGAAPAPTATDVSGDLEASGRFAAYLASNGERRVLDLDAKKTVFSRNLGTGPASLNGPTLWSATGAVGSVNAIDVRTGATRTIPVADCALKDVQSVGVDLYWKCDLKSGVLNTVTKVNTVLPAHAAARLGDGYVTYEKDGVLSLTPLRGGGQTRELGRPADVRPDRGWSVDRFGGNTVFTDDQQRLHVVPSGVPASAVSVLDSSVSSDKVDVEGGDAWTARWWLSKPAASWTLNVKNAAGKVVRTYAGQQTRGLVKAAWDGNDAAGAVVPDGRYTWELSAPPADGAGATLTTGGAVFVTRGGISTFKPVPPARILNTIAGIGAPKAKVGQNGTVDLQVTGRGGVAAEGVSAVVLTVTATNPTNGTWLSVYPYGTPRSSASNLNVPAGRSVPNQVTVPVGKDGKVSLYNAWGTVDLLVDVTGYYTLDGAGDRFKAVSPARILNTLAGVGAPKAKVGAAKTVNLQIAGRGGVPSTGVTAVVMNVTATNVTASSYISVYPYGTPRPATSNLNVVKGQVVANLVTVPVKSGKVTLYNHGGTVDLLGDVAGYFTNTAGQGDRFVPLRPVRLLDTREYGADGKLGPDSAVILGVAGYGGIPETGASSLVLNVAGTNATSATYVAIHPWLTARPTISNLNLVPRLTVANQVVVPLSAEGSIDLYNRSGYVDLVVDAAGYYTK
ncbi:FlgD immunoglobulin-like domain containing protein [Streptomyces sp. NPDC053431]|uniref:FlgD immunoglobulin-like domain containing protein n=1 Tax=Streptomyces sp. NPDC053431 TaxID=3365703 RepID=UPI0037D4C222